MSAKQNAQKIYREALKKEGLSEDELHNVFREKATSTTRRPFSRSSNSELTTSVGGVGGGGSSRNMSSFHGGGKSRSAIFDHSETVSEAAAAAAALDSLGTLKDFYIS